MNTRQVILIVEDYQDNLELLNFQLEILNFSSICASVGLKAISLAQTYQPDLILLDIVLPDISGIEVIHCLKQNPKTATIPIVAVTSMARVQDRIRILQAGADDCITKPYDLNLLEVVIRHQLFQVEEDNHVSTSCIVRDVD